MTWISNRNEFENLWRFVESNLDESKLSKLRGLRDTEMKFKKLLGLISNWCEIESALYETNQSESLFVTSVWKPIQDEAPSRTKDEISILTDKEKEISNLLAKCSTIRYILLDYQIRLKYFKKFYGEQRA